MSAFSGVDMKYKYKFGVGTLVHERFVLTIESMVQNTRSVDIRIYGSKCPSNFDLGINAIRENYNTAKKTFRPADFELKHLENDYKMSMPVLILMNTTLKNITSTIKPLEYPPKQDYWGPELCVMVGFSPFGRAQKLNNYDSIPLTVYKLDIYMTTKCGTGYKMEFSNFLCEYSSPNSTNSSTAICLLGDEGSPLLCKVSDQTAVIGNTTTKSNGTDQPLAIFGLSMFKNEISCSAKERLNSKHNQTFVGMFRYSQWVDEVIKDEIKIEEEEMKLKNIITAEQMNNDTNTTSTMTKEIIKTTKKITTTTQLTTEKLPEYYNDDYYNLMRKKPVQCKSSYFLSNFLQLNEAFTKISVNNAIRCVYSNRLHLFFKIIASLTTYFFEKIYY